MKPVPFIFLLLMLVACGNKKPIKVTGEEQLTEFEFLQDFHNFGKLKAGEVVSFGFELVNKGEATLFIKKVEDDCGCIHVNYPEKGIEAGEKTYIEVVLNTAGEVGKLYKTITLHTNTKEKKQFIIVAANVENELIKLSNTN